MKVSGCEASAQRFERYALVALNIDRLRLIYVDKSAANIYRLLMQYYRYNEKTEDSMGVHLGEIDEMRNQLAEVASGSKLTENLYLMKIKRRGSDESGEALIANTMDNYHCRLGDVSTDRIKTLLKNLGLEVPKGEEVKCETCPAGEE